MIDHHRQSGRPNELPSRKGCHGSLLVSLVRAWPGIYSYSYAATLAGWPCGSLFRSGWRPMHSEQESTFWLFLTSLRTALSR